MILSFSVRARSYVHACVREQCIYSLTFTVNVGEKMETCRIRGYLPTKMVFFLMNLRLQKQPIWFSRHGESQYNVECKIGGDSDLSPQVWCIDVCVGDHGSVYHTINPALE